MILRNEVYRIYIGGEKETTLGWQELRYHVGAEKV